MKYSFQINQKVFFERFPKVDLVGAIIFDVLRAFCSTKTKGMKKMLFDNEEFTWVNYAAVIRELPMLRIKSKDVVVRRIQMLKDAKLIKTFMAPDRTVYIRLNEPAMELEFDYTSSRTGVYGQTNRAVRQDVQHNQDTNNQDTSNQYGVLAAHGAADPKGIHEVFRVFYESVNPNINFGNVTSRKAAEWLIGKYGLEKTLGSAKYAVSVQGRQYSPTITNPYQLKEKMSALAIYAQREKGRGSKIVKI